MPHPSDRPLADGEPVLLVDPKQRRYYAVLQTGGRTDIRGHQFAHDELIGHTEGFTLRSSRGTPFHVLRPTLAEHVVLMPRTQTVIYPKDIATILVNGDVYPGATVLEAGVGSGALAGALLRAVGREGRVISYELREDAANRARKNIRLLMGEPENHELRMGDVYEGIEERGLDRIILDVPEPWRVVPHAARALRDGGGLVCYLPTVLQVKETADTLQHHPAFVNVEVSETLERPWHVAGRSIRPELQMVGHTGFLVFARKIQTDPELLDAVERRLAERYARPPADGDAPPDPDEA